MKYKEVHLAQRIDYAINEIDIKIESIKIDLDRFVDNLEITFESIHESFKYDDTANLRSFRKLLKTITKDPHFILFAINLFKISKKIYKNHIIEFHELDAELKRIGGYQQQIQQQLVQRPTSSRSRLVRVNQMYECESYVQVLNKLNSSYKNIFRGLSIVNGEIDIKARVLGKYVNLNKMTLDDFETSTPSVLDFKQYRYLRYLCNLNDRQLLISDAKSNKISIYDHKMELIRDLSSIKNERFEYPCGICTDQNDSVFICDHNNNRIIVTDLNFDIVKTVFGRYGIKNGEFDCPIEACFYGHSLYVLDRGNKRIQQFTSNGQFMRILKLYKLEQKNDAYEMTLLTFPLSFQIAFDKLVVLNLSKVYVYTIEGTLIQTFVPNNINCIMFLNDKLFTFNNESYLTCYLRTTSSKNNNYFEFVEAYHYRFETLKMHQIMYMTTFNGNLIATSDKTKSFIII